MIANIIFGLIIGVIIWVIFGRIDFGIVAMVVMSLLMWLRD